MKSKNIILIFGVILVMICSVMTVNATENMDKNTITQLYKEKNSFSNQLISEKVLEKENPIVGLHGPVTALSGQSISIDALVKNINASLVRKGTVDIYFDDYKIKTQKVTGGSIIVPYRIPFTCKGNHIITAVYTYNGKTITNSYMINIS